MKTNIKIFALTILLGIGALHAADLPAHLASAPSTGISPQARALLLAARNDDVASVRALTVKHISVNVELGDGMTPLHWAAYNDDVELGQLLLHAGAFPEQRTRVEGITPLLFAAGNGSAEFVKLLLDAHAGANVPNDRGTTPLMLAAASGNTQTIQLLLDRGAKINARENTYGQSALFFAADHNRSDAVHLLIGRGADPALRTTVAKLARISVNIDGEPIVEGKPGAGIKPGDAGAKAAPAADQTGEQQTRRRSFRAAAENASDDAKAASGAAGAKGGAIVKDPTRDAYGFTAADRRSRVYGSQALGGLSALHVAARDGRKDAVVALLDAGADINQVTDTDHATPLVLAIINGHYDLAKLLLERGADPKLLTTDGLGPIYAVIDVQWAPHTWYPQPVVAQETTPYLDLVSELIAHGADVNAKLERKLWFRVFANDETWIDVAGATPVFRAALSGDLDAIKLLVAKGADPNIATTGGDTPLMAVAGVGWAAYWTSNAPDSRLDAAKFLLDHGAQVNAQDGKGYTALHGAGFRGDNDLVKYLVSVGADAKMRNKEGESTADVANGLFEHALPHADTVALLESFGSANAHNCRSNECVVAPKEDKAVLAKNDEHAGAKSSPAAGEKKVP